MGIKAENRPLTMAHGFTETHIAINFSTPVAQLLLTPDETNELIGALQQSLKMQAEHGVARH